MKNWIWFEIRNMAILLLIVLLGLCFGGIKVQATNTLKYTYQAPAEYDQAEEQRFRNNISQRIQELEGR